MSHMQKGGGACLPLHLAKDISHQVACIYCKVPRFSDTRNLCCNLPKIQTKRPIVRVFHKKDANGIANIEDPGQTAPRRSSLI